VTLAPDAGVTLAVTRILTGIEPRLAALVGAVIVTAGSPFMIFVTGKD
jgi:hypothetical protein